jgi:3-hydroxybutyryl-CoA dehydrogenase
MTPNVKPVCVIGAGTMGRGIAQVALAAGHRVSLVDPAVTQLESARAEIAHHLGRRHPAVVEVLDDRLAVFAAVTEAPPADGTVVIEAVLEDLSVKGGVLAAAHAHFGDTCVLATNTSSLSVSAIAAASGAASRVVGMHFFNPVPLMRLVEVVTGLQTDPALADEIAELARAWGKTVARVRSAPGFVVNRVARAFYGEPLRLLEERAASVETLDEVVRAGGFRMGPFELMDLIGNDVNGAVTRTVWSAFHFDPRFTPSRLQDELVLAGHYGRKSGRGFYDYADTAERTPPTGLEGRAPRVVELSGSCPQLEALVTRSGCEARRDPSAVGRASARLPDGTCVVVTAGRTAREEAARLARPVTVIDRCVDAGTVRGLALAGSEASALEAAAGLLGAAGVAAWPVADVPGLVMARTLALIANEAHETALQGIASPDDVDAAMQLGTNYPVGPFTWTRRWTAGAVAEILDALWGACHDPRYRASRMLREAALG